MLERLVAGDAQGYFDRFAGTAPDLAQLSIDFGFGEALARDEPRSQGQAARDHDLAFPVPIDIGPRPSTHHEASNFRQRMYSAYPARMSLCSSL
ncbi:hypothetical protein NKI78_20905 [Mesorhizobium sp. M0400]|uniref:hypothetical protein n=1 Tax=Mesorhizobium sp. M0400 TaxID=2956941 RepID=UPI00333B79D2